MKLKALAQQLPVPLAVAGGLLAGAVGFLWHQRDILYEVSQPQQQRCMEAQWIAAGI